MIFSNIKYAKRYGFEKAFEFLKNAKELEAGKYPIDGDKLFAIVQENVPKKPDEAKFEAHKKYIDIQYIISGKERIDFSPLEDMSVLAEYNPEKDVSFLSGEARSSLILKDGDFAVFFPEDAHRPGIEAEESQKLIRKVVVKIKL